MKEKIIICIDNLGDIEKLKKVGIKTFLFPLEDFSIGHNSFKLSDIKDENSYLLINRLLDCNDVDNLKELLKGLPANIKGIFFEDVAVYQIVKGKNLNIELIWSQNHFGTSTENINYWLEKVDSALVSNEITEEEIGIICKNSIKRVVLQIFGYNQIMYSRRKLISNYKENFGLPKSNIEYLKELKEDINFIAIENEYGTVFVNRNIYDGTSLRKLENVKFYYIDGSMIDVNEIILLIENDFDVKKTSLKTDRGFLDTKTIYKLKGE